MGKIQFVKKVCTLSIVKAPEGIERTRYFSDLSFWVKMAGEIKRGTARIVGIEGFCYLFYGCLLVFNVRYEEETRREATCHDLE